MKSFSSSDWLKSMLIHIKTIKAIPNTFRLSPDPFLVRTKNGSAPRQKNKV